MLVTLCMWANAQFAHQDQQYHLRSSYAPVTTRRENIVTTRRIRHPTSVTPIVVNVTQSNNVCNASARSRPYVMGMCSIAISLCLMTLICNVLWPDEEERNEHFNPH